jgi:hypothetical protein
LRKRANEFLQDRLTAIGAEQYWDKFSVVEMIVLWVLIHVIHAKSYHLYRGVLISDGAPEATEKAVIRYFEALMW